MIAPYPHRRGRPPKGFGTSLGMSLALMLLVAGGVADQGGVFPLVVLGGAAAAVGALYLIYPHGPQFALGTANGLAMYACLYAVLGRAGFPEAPPAARMIGFLLPVAGFVAACWVKRGVLRAWAQGEEAADIAHLPRFARWLVAVGLVGVVSLSVPINRLGEPQQGAALLAAMGAITVISVTAVADVVRLLVDVAVIFRAVTLRLSRLAVPIAAFSSLWALLVVIFGSLYRIADGLSSHPLFHGPEGAIRIDFSDALHFSVVTLSSVGYGDIQPVDDGIRVLASIQMLFAQLLLLFGFYEIMRGSRAGNPDAQASTPSRSQHQGAAPLPSHAAPQEARPGAAGD
ncbi:potassium channel family protein [Paracraurococcus lichenis]|uniref:Ion channel n=1 Tax=Paracraurococcus lichenis TaxID=3064888 RepID=A0ABT9E8H5_9PROT|nr:potassium channel family protein [Paracraurococcus sp. LOR1-02]MDO9712422.1 ion channel [Paracraurococcus sp. LOR1-02]